MFFKRKQPTDKQVQDIIYIWCMLDSWRLDNKKGLMTADESIAVVAAIMQQMGLGHQIKDNAQIISGFCSIQADAELYRAERERIGFDKTLPQLFGTSDLPPEMYT